MQVHPVQSALQYENRLRRISIETEHFVLMWRDYDEFVRGQNVVLHACPCKDSRAGMDVAGQADIPVALDVAA